jgi:hypothetical protein
VVCPRAGAPLGADGLAKELFFNSRGYKLRWRPPARPAQLRRATVSAGRTACHARAMMRPLTRRDVSACCVQDQPTAMVGRWWQPVPARQTAPGKAGTDRNGLPGMPPLDTCTCRSRNRFGRATVCARAVPAARPVGGRHPHTDRHGPGMARNCVDLQHQSQAKPRRTLVRWLTAGTGTGSAAG